MDAFLVPLLEAILYVIVYLWDLCRALIRFIGHRKWKNFREDIRTGNRERPYLLPPDKIRDSLRERILEKRRQAEIQRKNKDSGGQ